MTNHFLRHRPVERLALAAAAAAIMLATPAYASGS